MKIGVFIIPKKYIPSSHNYLSTVLPLLFPNDIIRLSSYAYFLLRNAEYSFDQSVIQIKYITRIYFVFSPSIPILDLIHQSRFWIVNLGPPYNPLIRIGYIICQFKLIMQYINPDWSYNPSIRNDTIVRQPGFKARLLKNLNKHLSIDLTFSKFNT